MNRNSAHEPLTSRRSGRSGLAAVLVTAGLIVGCTTSSSDVTTNSSRRISAEAASTPSDDTAAPRAAAVDPPPVPSAPAAGVVPDGDPAGQATALAAATAPGSSGSDAAWLAVYDLARVPVLTDDGIGLGTTGDDPLGPGWWQVWMLSEPSPGQGMPLPDVLKILISPGDTAAPDAVAAEAAVVLLTDLAAAAVADDPVARFTAAFIDAKAQQSGTPGSMFTPGFDPATSTIDPPTAHLIVWLALRAEAVWIAQSPQPPGATEVTTAGFASEPRLSGAPPSGRPCSQAWGDDQVTWVTNWITNKVLGGVTLPGVNLKGYLEKLADWNPHIVSASSFEKFSKLAGKVNGVTSIASFVMQYMAIDIASAGDTLDRTRTVTDGSSVVLRFDILLDPGKLPDGNDKALCALSFLLNGVGISFNFPAGGFLPGVSVAVTGGQGFGERVLFGDFEQLKQDTDATGSIYVKILGKGQRREIPATAPRVGKEYTVQVEATPEPLDGNSLFNTLFDSLTATATLNPLALVSVVLDVMKTAHWDLPDQTFPMQDWASGQAFTASSGPEHNSLGGTICDLTKPFTLRDTTPLTFTFTPDTTGLAGTVVSFGQVDRATFDLSGDYTVTISGEGGELFMQLTGIASGDGVSVPATWAAIVELTPAPTCAG